MTGGLHLDGVADVFDGLGGGHGDRERILRIMRDSRIGAHGATALVLVLAVKVAALAELLGRGALWPLVVAPAVARFAVVPLIVLLPYARRGGARELVPPDGGPRGDRDRRGPRHGGVGAVRAGVARACGGRARRGGRGRAAP